MTTTKDGALYDDFGNLIQPAGGKGTAFVNERGNIELRQAVNQERILERNVGCWNCVSFDTGLAYDAVLKSCFQRDVIAFKAQGLPIERARQKANETRRVLIAKKGPIGVCIIGKTEGDFVTNRHLCESWTGVTGASLARSAGEPLSPLVAEEIDKRGLDK